MNHHVFELIHERILARAHADGILDASQPVTWQRGHEGLLRTAARRAALDAEEALWLVVCEELQAHRALSYGSLPEYISAATGRDVHTAMERLRVARALVRLPGVFEKLADGDLSWSGVRELTRVVTPETEAQWLDACKDLRVQDIERLVAGRRPGDLPTTPADDAARRHVVRFDVEASTLALVRQAQDEYRRRTGESVDDDALLAALARAYLSSTEATSSPAAQVMVTLCPSCHSAAVDAGGERLPLSSAERDHLCCDATVLPTAQTEPVVTSSPTSHVGRSADPAPAAAPAPSHVGSTLDPIVAPVAHPMADEEPSVVMAEMERRAALKVATQMPDTVRRSVLRRHNNRCAVPGCSNGAHLHVHHCDLRSEGGTHDPDRLLPICDVHHRAIHDGRLVIDGSWSKGFGFWHADGTPYGIRALPDPAKSEAARIAFSALCKSGYKQSEARAMIDSIRDRTTPDMSIEQIVRLAFAAGADLPSQRHAFQVREPLAQYRPVRAVA
jgi:hypothetical protein